MNIDSLNVTFAIDDALYSVPARHVQEVIRHLAITPVARAGADVAGLINLRGQVVTAVDLRRRLGLGDDRPEAPMFVVVRDGDETLALVVDRIGEVVHFDPDSLEAPPSTVAGPLREALLGVFKRDDALIGILDLTKVCRPQASSS